MKTRLSSFLAVAAAVLALTGCETTKQSPSGAYFKHDAAAKLPKNPNNVRVKVSLQNQATYVMEGNEALMVIPVSVGTAKDPTPKGNFQVREKVAKRRAVTHGYFVNPSTGETRKGKLSERPRGWNFVGTPMPYWVGFLPAYGFHTGWVHPTPRTHGCIRLHENDAPEFFRLVKIGTPISIANTQPEDATIGKNIPRPPSPSNLPDYAPAFEMGPKIFEKHTPVDFVND
jgi:hypothetical protein